MTEFKEKEAGRSACPCGCQLGGDDPDCKRHEPIAGRGQRYKESQRFLSVSPYPKRRKPRTPKPGEKASTVVLNVTEDPQSGKALIRGRGVPMVLAIANATETAEWRVGAKGYVVPIDILPDIAAATDYLNGYYRTKVVQP